MRSLFLWKLWVYLLPGSYIFLFFPGSRNPSHSDSLNLNISQYHIYHICDYFSIISSVFNYFNAFWGAFSGPDFSTYLHTPQNEPLTPSPRSISHSSKKGSRGISETLEFTGLLNYQSRITQ